MKAAISLLTGFIFAIGLGISGMTQPHIVKGFLDIFGQWDPRLMGVMIGAILVHGIAYRIILKRKSPVLDTRFHIPVESSIDKRLIFGAVIFGLGWGWAGICPGPGIVAMTSGRPEFLYFILSMLVGMKVFQLLEARIFKPS